MIIDVVKVFVPAAFAFIVGILLTPYLTSFLYKHQMWKKKAKMVTIDGNAATIFNELHKEKEVGTPRLGGIIIWSVAIIVPLIFWLLAIFVGGDIFSKLDFISRSQTWIPLFTLLAGGIVGMIDDLMEIKGTASYIAGGLSLSKRLLAVGVVGLVCALWFYFKLEVSSIGWPFSSGINVGLLFIPLFVIVMVALYSGGVIDGIDGLSGGVFAIMFGAYAVIAFYQLQINLAAFSATLVGAILAFLWFNIPPARFYMSETGSMALTITLAVVAFMTDSLGDGHGIIVLPIIALPLVVTTASVIIQLLSKKFRGKKVFRVAPLHHHFEALGWPSAKVTMRYWVISIIFAIIGVTIALIG